MQHILAKLGPHGRAGVVMANGSMSSRQSGEGEIRAAIVEADLVSCVVALPDRLFRSTQIPACLWFLDRNKDTPGQVLFIDARDMGTMVDRTERVLTGDDIARIAGRLPVLARPRPFGRPGVLPVGGRGRDQIP